MELIHLLRALWRRRLAIAAASVVPALVFGLLIYFGPRAYEVDLEYNFSVNSIHYKKLTDRFYSGENIAKIAASLERDGAADLAQAVRATQETDNLPNIISFRLTPAYIDFANKEKLKLSLERSWADNVEKLEGLHAELLTIRLRASSREDAAKLAAWTRYNFEQQAPMYEIDDHWRELRLELNTQLGRIEGVRFELAQAKRHAEGVLRQLEAVNDRGATAAADPQVNLTFEDVAKSDRFLPLPLQIQALASEAARHDQSLQTKAREHAFKTEALALATELGEATRANLDQPVALRDYLAETRARLNSLSSPELRDFLLTHLRHAENLALDRASTTRGDQPKPQARGTIQKTFFAFAILFMAAIVVVSLREYALRAARD